MIDVLEPWLAAMREGDFERAWQLSDVTLHARRGKTFHHLPRHEQPIWDGTPLADRRVLVRCYHGLGDTIQFARYLPRLKRVAREVLVWAQPPLLQLLSTAGGSDRLLPLHDGAPGVPYDTDVEIMELPYVFRTTTATIPAEVPYLHVSPAPLSSGDALRVGLVWEAGDWNPTRSIPFALLDPLLACAGVTFYGLQVERPPAGLIADERRTSIGGLAQLIRALDLVISVDTMAAHLAGALGAQVWTLLPYEADWRWMQRRSDSPWYPTMRLFRQGADRRWEPVIASVAAEIAAPSPGLRPPSPAHAGEGQPEPSPA